MLFNKMGIGPIVAVALLMVVSVTSVVILQGWYSTYQSNFLTDVEMKNSNLIGLEYLDSDLLYVKSSNPENVSFTDIKIDDVSCGISGNLTYGINSISLSGCTILMSTGYKEVVLITDLGFFTETLALKSVEIGNLSISFSLPCQSGYTEIFARDLTDESHAEIASLSNYNSFGVCLSHQTYTINTSCSGIYNRVFYLDNETNAHIYTSNTSSYAPIYTWNEVCISADNGASSVDVQISDSNPGEYVCIGSFDTSLTINNTLGEHLDSCDGSNDIWLDIQ